MPLEDNHLNRFSEENFVTYASLDRVVHHPLHRNVVFHHHPGNQMIIFISFSSIDVHLPLLFFCLLLFRKYETVKRTLTYTLLLATARQFTFFSFPHLLLGREVVMP